MLGPGFARATVVDENATEQTEASSEMSGAVTMLASLMPSRLVWRRASTAIGIYASTALGVLGSLVAANILGPADFGRLALVIATTALFQLPRWLRVAKSAS